MYILKKLSSTIKLISLQVRVGNISGNYPGSVGWDSSGKFYRESHTMCKHNKWGYGRKSGFCVKCVQG